MICYVMLLFLGGPVPVQLRGCFQTKEACEVAAEYNEALLSTPNYRARAKCAKSGSPRIGPDDQ